MQDYSITRRISIDAAHRVSTHGSKCRNLHGHRYLIEATCSASAGALHGSGEQTDMLLDFAFLKELMERLISDPCDHSLIACIGDLELLRMLAPEGADFEDWKSQRQLEIKEQGFSSTSAARLETSLYVVACQPTAERLAEHWFGKLAGPVGEISDGMAELQRVRVWETPNCYADFVRRQG